MRPSTLVLLAVACLVAGTGAAPAVAAEPDFLAADVSRAGQVNLAFFSGAGAEVSFFERVGASRIPLGRAATQGPGIATVLGATTWRCDRLVRRFEASAVRAGGAVVTGSFAVRTPSCRDRFTVAVPARVAPRALVRIAVADRWGLGDVPARRCAGTARLACRPVVPAAAVTVRHVRAGRGGRVRIELRTAHGTTRRAAAVGPRAAVAPAPPLVLTTGDSTAQGLGGVLADLLGGAARVRDDVLVGTGVSKPGAPGWPAVAARQAAALRPAATVVSVGANEGFPMRTTAGVDVACCGPAWEAELAGRQRRMMAAWARDGAARVLWLALPAPRDPRRAAITAAVNRATARAVPGLPEVTLVRLDAVLSPGGAFTRTLRDRGRTVVVREPDGIHLSPDGTRIAARVVAAALRTAGVVR